MADVSNGKSRLRAWPKKRGKPKSQKQRDQNEWFRQVQLAFKYMDPRIQVMFREATDGTPFLPRDLFTQMQAGRFALFRQPNGRIIPTMATIQDVSLSLDTLGASYGDMLFRGPQFWTAVPYLGNGQLQTRLIINSSPGTSSGETPIPWQAAEFDDAGLWTIAQPTRMTFPPGVTRAEFFAGVRFEGGNSVNCAIGIIKNGAERIAMNAYDSGWTNQTISVASGPINIQTGDYVEAAYQLQSTSGKMMVPSRTFFSANVWLAPSP